MKTKTAFLSILLMGASITLTSLSVNAAPQRNEKPTEGVIERVTQIPSSTGKTTSNQPVSIFGKQANTSKTDKDISRKTQISDKPQITPAPRTPVMEMPLKANTPQPTVQPIKAVPQIVEPVEAPVQTKPIWVAPKDKSLNEVLKAWSEEAGWSVVWNSDYDYILRAGVEFESSFIEASTALIEAFEKADPPVFAEFYNKNRVIVVTTPTNLDIN